MERKREEIRGEKERGNEGRNSRFYWKKVCSADKVFSICTPFLSFMMARSSVNPTKKIYIGFEKNKYQVRDYGHTAEFALGWTESWEAEIIKQKCKQDADFW